MCSLNAAISVAWASEKSGYPVAIHFGAGDFIYDCTQPAATHSNGRNVCVVLDERTHASEIRLTGEPGLTSIQTYPPHRTLFDVGEGAPKLKVTGVTFKAPLYTYYGHGHTYYAHTYHLYAHYGFTNLLRLRHFQSIPQTSSKP